MCYCLLAAISKQLQSPGIQNKGRQHLCPLKRGQSGVWNTRQKAWECSWAVKTHGGFAMNAGIAERGHWIHTHCPKPLCASLQGQPSLPSPTAIIKGFPLTMNRCSPTQTTRLQTKDYKQGLNPSTVHCSGEGGQVAQGNSGSVPMRRWEIAAAHLDLITPCWLCWLGSRWRHGLNQTARKIQAVELFLQVSDSLQIKAQMMEKLLSQAILFSHIFYIIYSFIHLAIIDHKDLVHQMSLTMHAGHLQCSHTFGTCYVQKRSWEFW